uniref:Uncharacterized protein n=2 Tax=Auxenochlorella protothecoides TaxID=3075 RepID=A0A1D2ABD3_AUXPR
MGSHGTPWRSCLVCLLAASTWAGVAARLAPSLNASADLLDLDAPHEWQPCARGLHTSDMTLCFLGGALCPAPLFGEEGPLGLTAPFHRRDPHKDLFPLNLRDIIGLTLASLALALAASGGLGGGGILVPLYLIVLRFDTYSAVALSNVTIVGGTLTNLAINIGRRHPLRDAPLIDWDLILVMEPSTILGAILGTYVNHVLPPWLTTISLGLLLTFITYKLVVKARSLSARDAKADRALRAAHAELDAGGGDLHDSVAAAAVAAEDGGSASDGSAPTSAAPSAADLAATDGASAPLLPPAQRPRRRERVKRLARRALAHYRVEVPGLKLAVLFLMLACVVASDLAKTRFRCPSPAYWAVVGALLPLTLTVMLAARAYLLRRAERLAARGHQYQEGDVQWDARSTLLFPALCTFAGLAAGVFGVGGGIVKGPLMLEMGVLPDVTAATSATMILFTSVSASVVFVSLGAVPLDYGLALAALGLVFTALGQGLVFWLSAKSGSRALIVWIMAAAMGISTAILLLQGGTMTWHAFLHHALWVFGGVCGKTSH